jgi:hypothetical protein
MRVLEDYQDRWKKFSLEIPLVASNYKYLISFGVISPTTWAYVYKFVWKVMMWKRN